MTEAPNAIDALCTRHRYPDALRAVMHEVVGACREAYPGLESLVLTGSAATGDYVYFEEDGRTQLVSDLDLMLFVDSKNARAELLRDAVKAIKARHPSPIFDVDIAINSLRALERVPPRFQVVEARQEGVVLCGRDVLDRFPSSFDPDAAIAAFLNNLWKPFLYWTPRGGDLDLEYQQMVARLFLDVPLLVCARNRECIAGHRARGEAYLAESSRSGLHAESIRERVQWALDVRRTPSREREGLEAAVADFACQVVSALDEGPVPDRFDARLASRFAKHLPRRTPRRVGGELRTLVRDPHAPLRDLAWWWQRKEAHAGAAMLGLLVHLGEIAGDPTTFDPPRETLERLAAFARSAPIERAAAEDGLEFLYRCKRIYRDALDAFFPSSAKADDRQAALLGAEVPGP